MKTRIERLSDEDEYIGSLLKRDLAALTMQAMISLRH
jgi:hypothetical protein